MKIIKRNETLTVVDEITHGRVLFDNKFVANKKIFDLIDILNSLADIRMIMKKIFIVNSFSCDFCFSTDPQKCLQANENPKLLYVDINENNFYKVFQYYYNIIHHSTIDKYEQTPKSKVVHLCYDCSYKLQNDIRKVFSNISSELNELNKHYLMKTL